MIIDFDLFLNEEISNKNELVEELKDAKYIHVDFNSKNGKWGVTYFKNGKNNTEGSFNTNAEVHEFLIDNDIEYDGKSGYLYMNKFRRKATVRIPYPAYQREIETKGIKDRI